jgi:hypothetical protein
MSFSILDARTDMWKKFGASMGAQAALAYQPLPYDPAVVRLFRHAMIEHRLVEIGRHNAHVNGEPRGDGSSKRAGAGSVHPAV